MKLLGLRDYPITDVKEETLGLNKYAKALSNFVRNCETPMTIALQGDWGSGKTSLMNLIREDLKTSKVTPIWFNTWQYSQFDLADKLPFMLILHLVSEINDSELLKFVKDASNILSKVTKGVVIGAASMIGQGDTTKAFYSTVESTDDSGDPATVITQLKEKLIKSVQNKIRKDKSERMVVFIDDIDRLKPARAVELLETLKLFLDIEKCVFILAVDYQVVIQGLKEKFGVGEADLKGKSFFDKIIQVPFNMPMEKYEVEQYFKSLLGTIGIEFEKEDIAIYRELVDYSTGFNPRSIKRLFNSLLLLKLVGEEEGLFDSTDKTSTNAEKLRIFFGILCLQMKYPFLYSFLNNVTLDKDLLEKFADVDWIHSEDFPSLKKLLSDEQKLKNTNISAVEENVNTILERYAEFMRVFYNAIQLNSDNDKEKLSDGEVENLSNIFKLSAVVAAEKDKEDSPILRKIGSDDFLDQGSLEEKTYYSKVFQFLHNKGITFTMGTKGFSIKENSGNQPVVHCYLASSGSKGKNRFWTKNIPAQGFKMLKGYLTEKKIVKQMSREKTVVFTIQDIPIEDFCNILAEITRN